MSTDRGKLFHAASGLCDAFACKKSLDEILSFFADSPDIFAMEHGHPGLAPFLGRRFTGRSGVEDYFKALSVLSYQSMNFTDYIIDTAVMKVSVLGQAEFTWSETGEKWDETFTYRLTFDGSFKVKAYEVWADTGAAYLASKGKLEDLK